MKNYILSIVTATLLAAVTDKLSPAGEGGRMVAHVRFLTALFLIVALIAPLREGVAYLKVLSEEDIAGIVGDWISTPEEDYSHLLGDTLSAVSAEEAEGWLKRTLDERFSIPPETCTLWVGCTANGMTVAFSEVRIALTGASALKDPHPIEAYVSEVLGCPCYVTVLVS